MTRCEDRLRALPQHLPGFAFRAAQALVHLADAWNMADASNSRGMVIAIDAVLETSAGCQKRFALIEVLRRELGDEGLPKLLAEIQAWKAGYR